MGLRKAFKRLDRSVRKNIKRIDESKRDVLRKADDAVRNKYKKADQLVREKYKKIDDLSKERFTKIYELKKKRDDEYDDMKHRQRRQTEKIIYGTEDKELIKERRRTAVSTVVAAVLTWFGFGAVGGAVAGGAQSYNAQSRAARQSQSTSNYSEGFMENVVNIPEIPPVYDYPPKIDGGIPSTSELSGRKLKSENDKPNYAVFVVVVIVGIILFSSTKFFKR